MAEPKMSAEEKKWRAEMDARTLAEADAIRSDPKRKQEASKAAKGLVAEEKQRAKESDKRAKAMGKVAKESGKTKPKASKPKPQRAKPKPPTRAAPKRSGGSRRKK